MSKPSIGRIVHFFPAVTDQQARHNGVQCVPAIIVSVGDNETGSCNLRVFQDGNNILWRPSIMNKEHAGKGQSYWEWPVIDESDFLGDVVEINEVDMPTIVREELAKILKELQADHEYPLSIFDTPPEAVNPAVGEESKEETKEATQPAKVEETEASQAPTEETTKTETQPKAGKKS